MPTNRSVTGYNALDGLRREMLQARRRGVAWDKIWESVPGVKIGTLKRIAFDDKYTPQRADIRTALGLPVTAPAPVCPRHGIFHKGRCPKRTFEENAAEYDRWRAANADRIAAILEWAER